MRIIGFTLSQSCFPLLLFPTLTCSFTLFLHHVALSSHAFFELLPLHSLTLFSLHTNLLYSFFWLYLMLITCCSRILIQPMSVFLFFHSPRFFWFVLCETLLIFCCLVPSFNHLIASPLLPCSCSAFLWIQCSLLLLKLSCILLSSFQNLLLCLSLQGLSCQLPALIQS